MRGAKNLAIVVERGGQFHRVVTDGRTVPFLDKVRARIDLREQVMSMAQATVYFQVVDPRAAAYDVANYISALEQAAQAALRTTSDLRQVQWELEQAAARWGVRVNRVTPPQP